MTLPDMTVDPNWADIATVAILGAQLVILVLAAVVGYFQVREARRLREQQARPFVVVDFEAEHGFVFYVSIANIGKTLARDVKISIKPDLTSSLDTGDESLGALRLFTEGIPSMPPEKKVRTILDSAIGRDSKDGFPDAYSATVVYWDAARRKRYEETIELDLGIYWGLTAIERHDIHDVHERLKEISKNLKRWTAPGGGLLRLSPSDVRARAMEILERRQQTRASKSGSDPNDP